MTNVTYAVWLGSFVEECVAFLRTDAKSKSLPVTALRPYPVRAEGDEKKQFSRKQVFDALREYLSVGVNGGTGTRPDGSEVEMKGYKVFNDLNAEKIGEVALIGACLLTHEHTPARGPNAGKRMTYNTMTQTIMRIKRANTALPERKARGRKLTADEKTWMRDNIGGDWWGPGADGKTDPVKKAASIARMDAEMHNTTPTETVVDTTAQPVEVQTEVNPVLARTMEIRKAFPDLSVDEAKELAEAGL